MDLQRSTEEPDSGARHALCPRCHEVKHLGLAEKNGKLLSALGSSHESNDISHQRAGVEVVAAITKYLERSRHSWWLDTSILQPYLSA